MISCADPREAVAKGRRSRKQLRKWANWRSSEDGHGRDTLQACLWKPSGTMSRPPDTAQVVFLGIGLLLWPEVEQKTGRYGTVGLHGDIDLPALFMPRAADLAVNGSRGKLRAIMLRHFKRKYHPGESAPIGAIVELGVGTIFSESTSSVGLWPVPFRELAWLDPAKLLLCAEQEVRLEFSLLDFIFEPSP